MTALCKGAVFAAFCCLFAVGSGAQRIYKAHSVLASGAWYKIGVSEEGIHRMDAAFLSSLGLGSSIPSSQLRVFGGESGMLAENNAAARIDDLGRSPSRWSTAATA
jgi:hypothetical protein